MSEEKESLDEVLAPLTGFRGCVDPLLDLRIAALKREQPGRCVQCYFKILGAAGARGMRAATPLRKWLEAHLVLVAEDENERLLETLPVQLEAADLDDYCEGMITVFRENRSYGVSSIGLRFNFRESIA